MELKERTIDLFGTKIKIKIVDKAIVPDNKDVLGFFDSDTNTIVIAKEIRGKVIPEAEQKLTFLHELIHAIFTTGLYLNSNEDEPLVEWVARCLNKCIKSKLL